MKSAPPEQVKTFFQKRQKVVLTFVGYYGSGYEHETTMLAEARKVLIAHSSQGTIVNIGAMPDGIGQVYAIAKEMGFETTGIASTQAQASQAAVSPHVDTVFFIDDAVWGGFLPDTEVLSPTSQLVVECSDIIIAIGGNAVTRDEMISARRLGKDTPIAASASVSSTRIHLWSDW